MVSLKHVRTETPTPGPAWRQLSDAERFLRVEEALGDAPEVGGLRVIAAKLDGQVIVNLVAPVPAAKRGTLLLDLEAFLKKAVEPALAVWLEPLGDRNSLRNLRGIEVKP